MQKGFYLFTIDDSQFTALLCLFVVGRADLFVGDPRDEESDPVFGRFEDGDADAGRAVDGGGDADDAGGGFDRRAVGTMRPQVELIAAIDLLIQMEERAGGGDVVRLGRLAPRRAVVRAARHDDGQAQRHA